MSLDKSSFPDDWKVVPVSDVVFFQEGPGVRRFQYTDSGVKLLNGGNINKGILNLSSTERYISEDEAYGKYKHFLVEEGDLLIACSGVVVEKFDGKIAYAKKEHLPLCMNTSTMRFRSLDKNVLHLDYFRWFLTTTYFKRQLQQLITGSAQLNFGPSHIKLMSIPLPPLETQKQIAAVLEKADQLRKDCQQMEQELNSLAQSVFIDMFGDQLSSVNKYTLGETANVVSGVTKGQKFGDKETVQAPYMRVANVQAGYLNLTEIKNIEVKVADVKKYKLEKGDVLLTEGGDHDKLGRGAIWNDEVLGCIHQNHVFRVRLDRSLYTPEWLNGYLKTSFAKRYFLKCSKKTTNLASINITQLKGLPMPDISINTQDEFESINKVVKEKLYINASLLSECEENFNSLMQSAFKGELNLKPSKTKAA